jgi:hypothetical protein
MEIWNLLDRVAERAISHSSWIDPIWVGIDKGNVPVKRRCLLRAVILAHLPFLHDAVLRGAGQAGRTRGRSSVAAPL